jgi:NADH-quinone oxidoreductase subunit H
MISYELAMGLSLASVVMTFGSLDLQAMVRSQGQSLGTWSGLSFLGVLPAWGIFLQPIAFVIVFTSGIAESKRIPFDLPESESELVSGYFTEYSGGKQAVFMLTDFAEIVLVSGIVTTLFFGGWQFPFLGREGFTFPGGFGVSLPNVVVALLQVMAFLGKVSFLCWLQILIRWTLPRFRYDQLMRLGWKGLVPLALVNVVVTAFVIVLAR